MGVNPAVWTRVPILVRVKRMPEGHTRFEWHLRRRLRGGGGAFGWKLWQCYVAHREMPWREAISQYRTYAYYWRTGDF